MPEPVLVIDLGGCKSILFGSLRIGQHPQVLRYALQDHAFAFLLFPLTNHCLVLEQRFQNLMFAQYIDVQHL